MLFARNPWPGAVGGGCRSLVASIMSLELGLAADPLAVFGLFT